MSDYENDFSDVEDDGSLDCTPTQVGSIKRGGYCMLKGKPCKVTDYSTAKPGKHGSAKATIVGVDIFTGKKYEGVGPTSANIMVPNVKKTEHVILAVKDGYAVLDVKVNGHLKEDLRMPEGDRKLCEQIEEHLDEERTTFVTVISACGQEKIIDTRTK